MKSYFKTQITKMAKYTIKKTMLGKEGTITFIPSHLPTYKCLIRHIKKEINLDPDLINIKRTLTDHTKQEIDPKLSQEQLQNQLKLDELKKKIFPLKKNKKNIKQGKLQKSSKIQQSSQSSQSSQSNIPPPILMNINFNPEQIDNDNDDDIDMENNNYMTN